MEWGDKGDRVIIEVVDMRKEAKEITFYKLFLWNPKFLTMVVDNLILMGVTINSEGTGRGVEEIGEEDSYRYL